MISSPLDALLTRLGAALDRRDLDSGLDELVRFIEEINLLPEVAGNVYESRELDVWCARFGSLIDGETPADLPFPIDAATQVYLVTALYPTGGHSGVIRDFIRAQPEARHLILLTDLGEKCDRPALEALFSAPNVALRWLDGTTPGERARHTLAALRQCRDARLFLFTHAQDAVAMAAAMAAEHPRVCFGHHCDHSLTLGMHVPGFRHLDFSSFAFHHCRESLGVAGNLYLPLTSTAQVARDPNAFSTGPGDGAFVTCCAGNGGKFQRPYGYPYPEMVAGILSRTAGRHLHIGDLRDDFLAAIGAALAEAGLARERFVHVPGVPDLGAAMAEYGVSLYLGSFPIGGAKGLIDVMGSGTPILGHRHLANAYLGGQCYLYPEAPVWHTPEECFDRLLAFEPALLREHSRLARAFWEANHGPGILEAALAGPEIREPVPAPAFTAAPPDALRSLLADPSRQEAFTASLSRVERLEKQLAKAKRENDKLAARVERLESRCQSLRQELDAPRPPKLLSLFRRKPR